jgi:radical SAM protein with 4Fe4S-binding SPASM domain
MCPNKDLKKEDKGKMSFDLYKKILDEAAEFVFDINLAHRGESLLHPDIIEMIEYANSKDLFTRLHTNGSLLTEDLSRKLVKSGLDRLSISFDGCEKETYEKIRVGGDFDKTVNNIIRFLELKKESSPKKPETAIEVINFNLENTEELLKTTQEFKKLFDGLPLNSLTIKELHNWAGEVGKEDRPKKYSACPFPWNVMVIFWDGAVLPCTQDFFGYYIAGNVKDSSLKEIWNNEKMASIRKKLAKKDIKDLETCSKCDRLWRKRFLGVPTEYLWKFIKNKMP